MWGVLLLSLACVPAGPPPVAQDAAALALWLGWGDLGIVEIQAAAGELPADATTMLEVWVSQAQTVGECQVVVLQDSVFMARLDTDFPSSGWSLQLTGSGPVSSLLEVREEGWGCTSTIVQVEVWGLVFSEEEAPGSWVDVELWELL